MRLLKTITGITLNERRQIKRNESIGCVDIAARTTWLMKVPCSKDAPRKNSKMGENTKKNRKDLPGRNHKKWQNRFCLKTRERKRQEQQTFYSEKYMFLTISNRKIFINKALVNQKKLIALYFSMLY